MLKKNLFGVLLLSSLSIAGSNAWRIPMAATIGTIFATNIVNATESGITVGIADKMTLVKANFSWLGKKDLYKIRDFNLNYYNRVSYGIWYEKGNASKIANNVLDFNPVFRLESDKIYLEYSTGISYMSDYKFDKANLDLGGNFQFNHFINLGVKVKKFTTSVGYAHYSNNNIFKTNNGINFIYLNFSYKY
jgi:hypothetical protein